MGGVICRWYGMFLGVTTTAAALLLVGVLATESMGLEGGKAVQLEALSQGAQQVTSPLEEKVVRVWRGLGRRLDQAGFILDAGLVLEGFKNSIGGLRTSSLVGAATFDLNLTFDPENLSGWKGCKFYIDLEDHAGRNPSEVLVGDLQVFDKLNAAPFLQIYELWYQQGLFEDKLRLKIGKVDANSEFSVIDNGLLFLNSSTQVSPTVSGFPTFPDPMPSINLFFTPDESHYVSFGAYYANRSVSFGDIKGSPEDAQPTFNGAFIISEAGLKWPRAGAFVGNGNLKLAAWTHTGTFTRFNGEQQQGTYGWYAIIDQTLWQPAGEPEDGRGLRAFLEYGRTQSSVNVIDWHAGGGFAWQGPFPARPKDVVGVSPQYAHISSQAGLPKSYELAIETFYRLKVAGWIEIQPDLQYIVNPGGQHPNALVGTVRMEANF
ncbi:MAG: carbohydrate porin [Deltaproteobacteria bacterium]